MCQNRVAWSETMANQKGIGITIRLDPAQIKQLDQLVAKLKGELPRGIQVTRTDALRNIVEGVLPGAQR